MQLLPDPSVDLTHRELLNQLSDLLIIHCYFCCGSLAFLKMDRVSPAEWNMVSITRLQRFDNHHGCHSPHLKSAHSWLRASPWGSSEEPYLLWNECMLLLWYFSPRSKVKMSHLTNNTYTDLRQSLQILLWVKRSLNCHLANEMSSPVPHEATSGA